MEKLEPYDLTPDPVESFARWFGLAQKNDFNPEAFSLATATLDGVPSSRILLLKGHGPGPQFRFFTHSTSQKGHDLQENPRACMVFYWGKSERQVRIYGAVKKLGRDETAKYFSSRAHMSQLASFISDQSEPIESRESLESKFDRAFENHKEGQVPLPENWQGYELEAKSFEFFVYGEHRLNDRFLYALQKDKTWSITRLQP
jgi:pyridoxamine 5'-phosphate oxidase